MDQFAQAEYMTPRNPASLRVIAALFSKNSLLLLPTPSSRECPKINRHTPRIEFPVKSRALRQLIISTSNKNGLFSALLFLANSSPVHKISDFQSKINRQPELIESPVSHSKQMGLPKINRQLSRPACLDAGRQSAAVQRSNGSAPTPAAQDVFPTPYTQNPTPFPSCATVSRLKMATIRVRSSSGIYEVVCARGAFAKSASLIKRLGDITGAFILSSPRVWEHWGRAVTRSLRAPKKNRIILFEDAETEKDLPNVEAICRALIRAGADRHSVLLAVGGGVVGDVAGFAAAMYLRGVRLIQIPTTLVAQVDSSLGGKTGVNLPEGKNLVGAFHPPRLVIADPELLSTLPHREYRSGLFEVVKYGVIADAKLFEFLEKRMDAIERRDPDALSWIILRCIAIKARVVSEDEREGGVRQILNFGHTLGHALEAATGYKRFAHGEAIGWGMISATLMGLATGRVSESDASRIIRLVANVGPLPSLRGIHASQLRPIVAGDKKARGGRVRWVLPRRIGKTEWGIEVPWKIVAQVFAELPAIAEKARA